jgi:hypothetical protein
MAELEVAEAATVAEPTLAEAAQRPNGSAVKAGRPVVKPPTPKRGAEPYLAIEVGPALASDGTLALRVASDAVGAARDAWSAICLLHEEVIGKVGPLNTEAAAQLKSRRLAHDQLMRALRRADAALAEIRVEQKELEGAIQRKTVPPRDKSDLAAAVLSMEIRAMLRQTSERDRFARIERAINQGNVAIVGAALEQPLLSGLSRERAAMLFASWRAKAAGPGPPGDNSRLCHR